MIKDRGRAIASSKWFLPLFSLGLGLVVLLLTSRSETIRGLTVGRDERFAQIDLRATAVAGLIVITAVIVAWLVEIARGNSGSPYGWLAAIAGLAYLLAVAFFRWRGSGTASGLRSMRASRDQP